MLNPPGSPGARPAAERAARDRRGSRVRPCTAAPAACASRSRRGCAEAAHVVVRRRPTAAAASTRPAVRPRVRLRPGHGAADPGPARGDRVARPRGHVRRRQPVPLLPPDRGSPDPVGRLRRDLPPRQPRGPRPRAPSGDLRAAGPTIREAFPQLDGIRFDYRWAGAIDTTTRFTVTFGETMGGRVHYALGYTGLGVGSTRWAAGILRDRLLRPDSPLLDLRFVRSTPFPIPPEPLRTPAVELMRREVSARTSTRGGDRLFFGRSNARHRLQQLRPHRARAPAGQAGAATTGRQLPGQGRQRQRSVAQQLVVERLEVERRAVARLELPAQPPDLAHSRSCRSVPGPATRCSGRSRSPRPLRQARLPAASRSTAAGPAEAVMPESTIRRDARPRLGVEHAEALGGTAVQAQLVGQPLGVQAPALDVGAGHHPRRAAGTR